MTLLKGLCLSLAFSGLAVGLWLGLSYLTGWGLGILVVLVGCAAGIGMVLGLRGKGSPAAGILAVLVAFVMMLGGKWGAAVIWAEQVKHELAREHHFNADEGRLELAEQVEEEFVDADQALGKPGDSGYSDEVILEVNQRWNAMTQAEQVAYWEKHARGDQSQASEESAVPFAIVPFIFNFGWTGLVLMGIGLSGAYRAAAVDNTQRQAEKATVEAPKQVPYGHARFANLGKCSDAPPTRPDARSDAA